MAEAPDSSAASPDEDRAGTLQRAHTGLVVCAAAYLALLATTGMTALRSIAFGIGLLLALRLMLAARTSTAEAIPSLDRYLVGTLMAWVGWSVATLAWSIDPEYTRSELHTEIGWGLATIVIFYVAARSDRDFRWLTTTAVAVGALLSAVAIVAIPARGDPVLALEPLHGGVGAFSTYLVMIVPLFPALCAPEPAGYGTARRPLIVSAAALALILVAARLSDNRMIWAAFAVGLLVSAALAAWRWRQHGSHSLVRWLAAILLLLTVLAGVFVSALIERGRTDFDTPVPLAQAIADDPRFVIWEYVVGEIDERPWTGFGFGKLIQRARLKRDLGDPMLAHAHNIFLSQWLQSGWVGVALLLALFAALSWRYWTFLRHADRTLALLGVSGLSMLASFLVKNLTDDFLSRPTSKEFWALNAVLIGYGIRRVQRASTLSGQTTV